MVFLLLIIQITFPACSENNMSINRNEEIDNELIIKSKISRSLEEKYFNILNISSLYKIYSLLDESEKSPIVYRAIIHYYISASKLSYNLILDNIKKEGNYEKIKNELKKIFPVIYMKNSPSNLKKSIFSYIKISFNNIKRFEQIKEPESFNDFYNEIEENNLDAELVKYLVLFFSAPGPFNKSILEERLTNNGEVNFKSFLQEYYDKYNGVNKTVRKYRDELDEIYGDLNFRNKDLGGIIKSIYTHSKKCKVDPSNKVFVADYQFCHTKYNISHVEIKKYLDIHRLSPYNEAVNFILAIVYSMSNELDESKLYFEKLEEIRNLTAENIESDNARLELKFLGIFHEGIRRYDYSEIVTVSNFYTYGFFRKYNKPSFNVAYLNDHFVGSVSLIKNAAGVAFYAIKNTSKDKKLHKYTDKFFFYTNPVQFGFNQLRYIKAISNIVDNYCIKDIEYNNCLGKDGIKWIKNSFPKFKDDHFKIGKNPYKDFISDPRLTAKVFFLQAAVPIIKTAGNIMHLTLTDIDGKGIYQEKPFETNKKSFYDSVHSAMNILPLITDEESIKQLESYIIESRNIIDTIGFMVHLHASVDCANKSNISMIMLSECVSEHINKAKKYLTSGNILDEKLAGLNKTLDEVIQQNKKNSSAIMERIEIGSELSKFRKKHKEQIQELTELRAQIKYQRERVREGEDIRRKLAQLREDAVRLSNESSLNSGNISRSKSVTYSQKQAYTCMDRNGKFFTSYKHEYETFCLELN